MQQAKRNLFNSDLNNNKSKEITQMGKAQTNTKKKKKEKNKKKQKRKSAININQIKSKRQNALNFPFSQIPKNKKRKSSQIIRERSNTGNTRSIINNNINNNLIIINGHNNKKNIKNKEILEDNDSELNSLEYQKALVQDKRTFIQYYISLLKINHLLIFSFYCNNKDYNSQIIKMFLFFFFFSIDFTTNALFFNDDTMHKIYIDEGKFNLIYQIPQIIY